MLLRIATLNVWALPFGIAPGLRERMDSLGERLQQGEADVWALQEVWTDDARTTLEAAARRAHLHVAHGGGGLMLASVMPLEDVHFTQYACRGIATHVHRGDWAGGKGFLSARVDTPDGPVRLLTTHLHAQYVQDGEDPFHAHRVGQTVELAHAVAGFGDPVVLAGDLNLREGRPEYVVLMGLSGLRDQAAEREHREPTSDSDTRIDYILTRGPRMHSVRNFIPRGLYSDHGGVWAELSAGPGSVPPTRSDPTALAVARRTLAEGRADAEQRRGRERALATGAALAGAGSLAAARITRRRFLFGAGAALGLAATALWGVSAERWIADEEDAFARVSALLDAF